MDVHPLVRKTLAFIVAIAAVVALTQVALASPAFAAWTTTKCPTTGQVCFSADINGNGAIFRDSGPIGACQDLSSIGWNDRISSLWNRFTSSGGHVWLYRDAGCGTPVENWSPGELDNDVGFIWNDEASSFCIGLRTGSVACP